MEYGDKQNGGLGETVDEEGGTDRRVLSKMDSAILSFLSVVL